MPKKSEKKPFTTRQETSLIKRVKKWAIDHEMSLQDMVALALEELMKKK
jgi:hypothetical protein